MSQGLAGRLLGCRPVTGNEESVRQPGDESVVQQNQPGNLLTARRRSSAATWGAWSTSRSAASASQSSIHLSIGSGVPPGPGYRLQ